MRWVKASDQLPSRNDTTSLDFSLGVVVRSFSVEKNDYFICVVSCDEVDGDDEWLEGWNIKNERLSKTHRK